MTPDEHKENFIQNLETQLRRAKAYAKQDEDTIIEQSKLIEARDLRIIELEKREKELGGEPWPMVLIPGEVYQSRLKGTVEFLCLKTGSEEFSPLEVPYFKERPTDKRFFIQKHDLHKHFHCAKQKPDSLINWVGL